jgi:thiamine biosynthesis lipoprotein
VTEDKKLDLATAPLVVEDISDSLVAVRFKAMAGPCELLMPSMDHGDARELGTVVAQEAWRVEKKFSRYRDDSMLAGILASRGKWVVLDEETAALVEFSRHCYEISEGLFDVTSGVLRRAWTFDGSDHVPDPELLSRLLPLVGFERMQWQSPRLLLPQDMELDFGGIGKEYAVDRAFDLLASQRSTPFLINFGGDLRANVPPAHGPWQVGIERPDSEREAAMILSVERGALATSGDSRRYVLKDGIRYGHILDPRTGWPIAGAPRSVTVAASSCTEAGLMATLAMLQGRGAESFLQEQGVRYWLIP